MVMHSSRFTLLLVLVAAGCTAPPQLVSAPSQATPAAPGGTCPLLQRMDVAAFISGPEIPRASTPLHSTVQDQCGIDRPITVTRLAVSILPPVTLSCAFATQLLHFERDIVMPLAERYFHQTVTGMTVLGGYACRAEKSNRTNRLSRHAFGAAIDLSGIILADGTRMNIIKDWKTPGKKREFLHEIARSACRYFSVVLTPDTNAQHQDHIHLDIGPDHYCATT